MAAGRGLMRCAARFSDTCCARAHQHVWQEVLRCVSRWELLVQVAAGGMTDALIFAAPAESPTASKRRPFFSVRSSRADAGACAALVHETRAWL